MTAAIVPFLPSVKVRLDRRDAKRIVNEAIGYVHVCGSTVTIAVIVDTSMLVKVKVVGIACPLIVALEPAWLVSRGASVPIKL